MFKNKIVFDGEVFKEGIPVYIEGKDTDGAEVNYYGLIKENNEDHITLTDYQGRENDYFIEEIIGSPAYQNKGYGFKVIILSKEEPQAEPKKKGGYKLSEDDVRSIRKLSRYNIPQSEIAEIFGVARSTISEILSGKIHSGIK
jgi:hypothetical protein